MELDLQSIFGLLCTAVLIGRDPATLPLLPHLGSYIRALLVSQDRRHLFVTPLIEINKQLYYLCLKYVPSGHWPELCNISYIVACGNVSIFVVGITCGQCSGSGAEFRLKAKCPFKR